jgi:hypothetical protein
MTSNQILAKIIEHKGQHVPAVWQRSLKTLKGVTQTVTKQTTAFVRAGIDYANLKSVKEGIESGERGEVQPLPSWSEWVQFPFILRHKENGTEYVRLYPASFDNLKEKNQVQYFLDGQPATLEQVRPLCLASEFRNSDEPLVCFTLKTESVLAIG